MRIVAGSLRGRRVDAPEGEGTRPTTDRVREALFSSLYSLRGGFEDAIVLDAFAGSGALGIEAISRGASRCVFCERDAKALAVLKRNIASCGLDAARAAVAAQDVLSRPPAAGASPFDLVFLDPPYAYEAADVLAMVRGMRDAGSIAEDAIVIYEHAKKSADEVETAAREAGLAVHAKKKYGKTAITILLAKDE